jgi:hypothetical protein
MDKNYENFHVNNFFHTSVNGLCFEDHVQHTNTLCRQNVAKLKVAKVNKSRESGRRGH